MSDVYIASACRTAIGRFGGSLKDTSAAEMGAIVIADALARAGVAADQVDEVLFGCVLQAGLGQNVARQAALTAGIPDAVPAMTINMVCASGMKSVVEAARAIIAGDADIVVAGGTENMSAAAYVAPDGRWGARLGNATLVDTVLRDGLTDALHGYHMGVTAENVASQWQVSRADMDELAFSSQEKAAAAVARGAFVDEIVPVPIKVKGGTESFDTDEHPRATSVAKLGALRPAFVADGSVTAGNASGLNDGAAALVLASARAVDRYSLKPIAKLIGWGQAGVDPAIMGVGPVEASRRALAKANLGVDDLDVIESNEAFAAQALAVSRELAFDPRRVNVNGGAIALGHPIGASGARIIVTLLHEMRKRSGVARGLATLCVGGGMGLATVFETCE